MPAKVFITLQGKGGVGKSFCTTMFAQYMQDRGQTIICVDADAINPTLMRYPPLNAIHIKLSDSTTIDPRALDRLIELLTNAPDDASVIVDVGSNGFITLMGYAVENLLFDMLTDMGHAVYIQTVIAGGPDLEETIKGTAALMTATSNNVPIILWLNEHLGPLEYKGRSIGELEFLQDAGSSVIGSVTLQNRNRQTFGIDMSQMLSQRLTFAEVMQSYDLMPRRRIQMVRDDIYAQLDAIAFLSAD